MPSQLQHLRAKIYPAKQFVQNAATAVTTRRISPQASNSVALLRIRDYFTFQQYLYPLALSLAENDVVPCLHLNASMVANIQSNRDLHLLKDPRIAVYFVKPPRADYLFQDYMCKDGVILTPDYYNAYGAGAIRLPMFAHNDFYFQRLDQFQPDIDQRRRFRVGFIGSAMPSGPGLRKYTGEEVERYFGLANRYSCKIALMDAFPQSGPEDRLFFHWVERDGKIAMQEYLDRLLTMDFFLHLPGVVMPECHHAIESMSRGCIPITAYGSHYTPHLRDGENCLMYDGSTASLVATVQKAQRLSDDVVGRMRENVMQYYASHLTLRAVGAEVISKYNAVNWIQLMGEWRSLYMLKRGQERRLNTGLVVNRSAT